MCGIVGLLDYSFYGAYNQIDVTISGMCDTLHHRGPDDSSVWIDAEVGIGLAHRRLSIVDLSPEGRQPMVSADGRYVIVFNGEIYNFRGLRKQLEEHGHQFRGHSDTEIMLASICQWGIEKALKQFVGMFAFAVWDRKERVLYLSRDRLGEKPLYYGWMGRVFLFGSELKALQAYPSWQRNIDRQALSLFLQYTYIPSPYSIYEGIYKLPPGTLLTLPLSEIYPNTLPKPLPYWSINSVIDAGIANPFSGSIKEAVDELEKLLYEAIGLQMVADVPLGAFLSGGVDSSTVVALMQLQSDRPVKTFTIGFNEATFNEAKHAKAIAQYLGTDHTELYITPSDAMLVIPHLPILYDEPFSDTSQIPTFLVSKMTKHHVTVSLSGDGGDELFGGYNRYRRADFGLRLNKLLGRHTIVRVLEKMLAIGTSMPCPLMEMGLRTTVNDNLRKGIEILDANTPTRLYERFLSHWSNSSEVVIGASNPVDLLNEMKFEAKFPNYLHWMRYVDLNTYLPDDILVKVDRAAMGVSLETRVPMLDYRIVEFALRLPTPMLMNHGQSKWILRQVLYKHIPKHLIERPKTGFSIPLHQWLRGPLREWAETLLNERRLREEGFLQPAPILQKWREYLSGVHDWHRYLWDVLMFQAWLEQSQSVSK